ncbi:MAG: PaaX family transcriptional regulator C-terminal domain-containing protein [Actinomycetes bacterium]|jgi:phenylacetic acid degradation operon negative regulatory protein
MTDAAEPSIPTRTFVMGMVRDDGSLVAADVYDAGHAVGFTIHQIRLCFARLVKEELLVQAGRGRGASFKLTRAGEREIGAEPSYLQLALDQDRGRAPWNGEWHLATFSVEESRRVDRNDLRETLVRLGGAPMNAGVYVCAHDWDDMVIDAADDLGLSSRVSLITAKRLRVGGETDERRVARMLWPLDELAEQWRVFVRRHRPAVGRIERIAGSASSPELVETMATVIALVAEFDECMRVDPLLPAELLPREWPGVAGRNVLLRAAGPISVLRQRTELPALFGRFDDVLDGAVDSPP